MTWYAKNRDRILQDHIQKQKEKFRGKILGTDYVKCLYCEMISTDLTTHLTRIHKLKPSEYSKTNQLRCTTYLRAQSERVKGSKNPAYQHGGRFSPFSEKFIKMDFDRQKLKEKVAATKLQNKSHPTTIEYWLKKADGKLHEAEKLLAKRQTTFSKKVCVAKHGKKEGLRIWKERQEKWQNTMNAKPEKERLRINSLKATRSSPVSISKTETTIFRKLRALFPELTTQHMIQRNSTQVFVYDMCLGKKLIEYQGDFWHANPKIYVKDWLNPQTKMTSRESWEKDELKKSVAMKNGYDLIAIWESDFRKAPKRIIKEAQSFLSK